MKRQERDDQNAFFMYENGLYHLPCEIKFIKILYWIKLPKILSIIIQTNWHQKLTSLPNPIFESERNAQNKIIDFF